MDSKRLLTHLFSLIVFIFLLNSIALMFHWYSSIWHFDMLMHFLGGAWLGLAGIYLFLSYSESFRLSLEPKALTEAMIKISFIVLFIGVGWEIFEILTDKLITQASFNFLDSVSDVFFDLAGGAFAVFYFFRRVTFVEEIKL